MPQQQSLGTTSSGQQVLVVGLDAGRKASSRLESLGVIPGVMLTVLSASGQGPLLISLEGSRFMLDRGMANKVLVA